MESIKSTDSELTDKLQTIYDLLLTMSANEYSENGSRDWKQRPECLHILSKINDLSIEYIIGENDLFFEAMMRNKYNMFLQYYFRCQPYYTIAHSTDVNSTDSKILCKLSSTILANFSFYYDQG